MIKHLKKIENLVVLLVVVSAIAILAFNTILREFTIHPGDQWHTMTSDDRSEGGNSAAADRSTHTEFSYTYKIKDGKTNAFAALMIRPAQEERVLDWNWMESISITAYIEGQESGNYRFQLRNRDEKFYVPDDSVSLRYNEVGLKLTNKPTTQTISRDKFIVAGWWVERYSVPLEYSTPSFDNIGWVELITGNVPNRGDCQVVIDEIKISGHWIPTSLFYRGILGMWLGFGSLVALSQIIGLRKRLMQSESMELRLQRQKAELAELATLDPLTQLFNRRGMRPHATLAMRELRQTGKSFSLIMFDIDNFKKLNDQNGHSYGDEILQHVALVVSESLTENDPAARWGGEEFVVICNDSNLDRATRLAENIRQRVESDIQITCSFGVCEVGAESEFSEALDLVDECLYRAKQDGKNCVKTATCVGPTNSQPAALIQDSGNF